MKYCSKCGRGNAQDAVFCAGCGTPLAQAPTAADFAPQAYAPAQETPAAPQDLYSAPVPPAPAQSPYGGPAAAPKNTSTLWLVLNIAALLLCCPGFLFSGAGIVFAALGMGSFNRGDYEGMAGKSKISMWLFIAGAVLGLLGWILGIVLWFVVKNNA